ncbi:hypothetical protein BDZ89DRAFT_1074521 [Hymenopellis radicata]|nr:hypothetical protein BDZ89DRAFT_1074521 [Hymenopellis radicata]
MAAALGSMTGQCLPLIYANCPYKTPLALYSFRLVSWVRRRVHSLRGTPSEAISRSLKDVERTAVSRQAEDLDALSICWLHNTSSNASVQCVALQSLGSLPLQSIPLITDPDGITAPISTPDACLAFDIVSEEVERPAVILAIRAITVMANPLIVWNARLAIDMVCKSFGQSPDSSDGSTFDVVFWGQVFEAALRPNLDQILRCAVQAHDCVASSCKGTEHALFSYSLGPQKNKFPLVINRYDLDQNGTSCTLPNALVTNMRPSFMRWVLHVGFPHVTRFPENYTEHIPDDVLVVLTLLQTRSVQATSSLCESDPYDRLFRKVLETVKEYVRARGPSSNHPDVDRAAICALQVLVNSESFGSSTLMTLADEALALECLFRGITRDPSWLTTALFNKFWHVATASLEIGATHNGWELVANIFAYVSHFTTHFVRQNWLQDIGDRFIRLANSVTPRKDMLPEFWSTGYIVIATTYIKALSTSTNASPVFADATAYLEDPQHLAAMSKILLLADAEKQNKLWDLAKLISSDSWSECVEALSQLVACEGMKNAYDHDQKRNNFLPPTYADPMHQATESPSSPTKRGFYKRWRKLLRHEPPITVPSFP